MIIYKGMSNEKGCRMEKTEILFLKPVLKETIWGGTRLKEEFQYEISSNTTGECWGISAHENGDCIVTGGTYDGVSLNELWNTHRELFGKIQGDRFPLLVKIIDAREDLSIQVHPDDRYASVHENGSLGKTECWYVLDCDPEATIVIGHNANTREEAARMMEEGHWNELIRRIPVHKGDFFQINPGCIHAIGKGTLLLETQQNSDITYRVYDYDRVSNGKPRELHIQKSLEVMEVPFSQVTAQAKMMEGRNYKREMLYQCPYYHVYRLSVRGSAALVQQDLFTNMSVIEGQGSIDGIAIKKGDHFILPSGYGEYRIEGDLDFITSTI